MIPVYEPYLTKEILQYAHDALDSTWISSKGEYISKTEAQLSGMHSVGDYRVNTALVCCNGTAATHLVAKVLRQSCPKVTKIIAPNNVYVAAWNSFLYDKEFELEVVETDPKTWNFDLDKLYEKLGTCNLETTALLAVHNLGNIVNVPKIQRDWKNIVVVEDNCEGFSGVYDGKPSGSVSLASSISFFGNKTITSGEGGAVITTDKWKSFLYKLRGQGQTNTRYIHDELGYNYRMTNVQAALIYGQLLQIDNIKKMKNGVFSMYRALFSDIDEITFQVSEPNTIHSDWVFGVRIKDNKSYDALEEFMHQNYIDVRPMFYHIHRHQHLKNVPVFGGSEVANKLSNECVLLPSHPTLKEHEICHVSNVLKQYIAKAV